MYDAIIALTQAQDAARESERRERQQVEADLNDPKLLRELEQMALDLINRYPHRVAEALRQAGWTVLELDEF